MRCRSYGGAGDLLPDRRVSVDSLCTDADGLRPETAPAASASVSATSSDRLVGSRHGNGEARLNAIGDDPGRGADRRPDPGRRTGRPALVRIRRSVALGPRAHEPGASGSGDVRRHRTSPHELDRLRLCGDRRGRRMADRLRSQYGREDRPGRRQGRYVDPGRIGTRRRRRDARRGVGRRPSRWGGYAHRSQDQPRRRDDPDRSDRSRRATDYDGWTRWCLGGRPQHGFGGADRSRDEQCRADGAAGRRGGE